MVATLVAPGDDEGETVGQLYDRLPASGDWLALPEYSVRVRRWPAAETPCRSEAPHAAHEWYGEPAALRRQCPGRPDTQA